MDSYGLKDFNYIDDNIIKRSPNKVIYNFNFLFRYQTWTQMTFLTIKLYSGLQ